MVEVDVDALYISGLNCLVTDFVVRYEWFTLWWLVLLPTQYSYLMELEWLIGIESELHCLVTIFVTSAILATDYFCLVSYISSDGHVSEVYLDCLVTALKGLLDVLYCRVTALDK